MCGIVGYVVPEDPAGFDLQRGVDVLRHRGPDADGVWREGIVGLGHTRLSIIDLSPAAAQPMVSDDGRLIVVFNGEVYNFPALRGGLEARGERFRSRSDTEVLLRLFALDGFDECLRKLRGMFAFALWDRGTRTLHLARDRMGVKPLVYAESPAGFVFASEIRALFAVQPTLGREPDDQALDHYFTCQYIPSPRTGFAAIRKLPPAHAMVVREGRIARRWRYWSIEPAKRPTLGFEEAKEAVREKILEATRIRMISDVPLGAFLSGGVDSSITVAAMARATGRPVKTYAIGFSEERFNELPYARTVATHLGTDHHELIVEPDAVATLPTLVEHCGEPMADNSLIPTYYVSQLARRHVTVALTGDGGDELFGGYRRFYQAAFLDWLEEHRLTPLWRTARKIGVAVERWTRSRRRHHRFPLTRMDEALGLDRAARYKHLTACFADDAKPALYTPEFAGRIDSTDTTRYLAERLEQARGADRVNRYLQVESETYMAEDVLYKVDICSMLHGLECRSPFLDHELVEFVSALPGSYKLRFPPRRYKVVLKEAFKDWLPRGFLDRPKMGFSVPMAEWLRGGLAPLMRERLLGERTLARWIRQDAVERYVREHESGTNSHSSRLWALLVLAEWVARFRVPR